MKKSLLIMLCVIMATACLVTTSVFAVKGEPTTVKQWLTAYIADNGGSATTDAQLKKYIESNKDMFFDVTLPESVTGFEGTALLFNAMGDETCTVTFNCEEQSDFNLLLNEVKGKNFNNNKCIKFGKTVWDFTLVVDAGGLDVQPRFQRQRPYLKETASFHFIDAIPEKFNIPVPIRVVNNSKAVLGEFKPSFNEGGIGAYDADPVGVRVERNDELITIIGLKTAAEISSEYGAVWYTRDGSAPGTSPSANQISYTFKTKIDVEYSVSLEPITSGAKDGTPVLKIDNKVIDKNAKTPKAENPAKDEFGRALDNGKLINRGTNTKMTLSAQMPRVQT